MHKLVVPRWGEAGTALQDYLTRFHPGGVVKIDPATVISAYPVGPYVVLPLEFGLAQVMEQRIIRREGKECIVVKPMPRFPAELTGAHAASFVLGPAGPLPPGDPGHSSLRECGGKCLVKMCR